LDATENLLKAVIEVIGVPTRHIHSHSAIMRRDDYDDALTLLGGVIKRLDAETVASLKG
jgi:putative aminopeptidase FrvX